VGQEVVDSDYLFGNFLQRPGFPSGDSSAGSFDYSKAVGYARANFVTNTIGHRTLDIEASAQKASDGSRG